jgi:hypothetical protein
MALSTSERWDASSGWSRRIFSRHTAAGTSTRTPDGSSPRLPNRPPSRQRFRCRPLSLLASRRHHPARTRPCERAAWIRPPRTSRHRSTYSRLTTMTSAGTRRSRKVRWRRTDSSASLSTSGSTTRKSTSLRGLASPRTWDPNRMTCASGATAANRRPASAIRVSSITCIGRNRSRHLRSPVRIGIARKNGTTMAAKGQHHSTSEHLAKMIAKGAVHPASGPRFLPRPMKAQPAEKTAVDWVVEGRRSVKPFSRATLEAGLLQIERRRGVRVGSEIAASMRPKCDLNSRGPEHVMLRHGEG